MGPLIYFSYGMTKSGSTLSFELARSAFILAGFDQPRLSLAAVEDRKKINFCTHIDEARADALREETAAIGHPIAVKTHTRPDPEVVKMLQNNEAFAHATYRDPREIALSMLDHGAKSRKTGAASFREYETLADTLEDIRHQTNSLLAWLSLPNVRPIYYDDVAFDQVTTTRSLIDDLGVEADAQDAIAMATGTRFTQKNKAKRARYVDEMSGDDSRTFEVIFAHMYERLIGPRQDFPKTRDPLLDPTIPLCDWSQTITSETGLHS